MKKEWKKVLSLVMALAMVLSTCTFVFAEGEEVEEVTPVQTVYDFAEFFETSDEFSGNPATDYDADGLTRVPTPNWKVGIFENGDTPFVDVFTTLNLMVRAGHYSRAICDTKNTTMTLVDGSQSSNVRIPNMMVVYNDGYLRSASPEKTYHHYDGTVSVIGDGGYSNGYHDTYSGNTFFWNYRGGVGYGFGNGTGMPNSGLTASIQGAVIFIVPRSGYIRPTVKVFHDDANSLSDLRFRLYKQDVDDNWTNIYPAEGEAAATITAGGSWTSSERLINGWVPVSQNSSVTRDDARLWVEAGEKIVLRVGSVTPGGGAYAIDTLKFEYITELDDLNSGYFPDTRIADVREAALPERTVYTVPEDSGLIPTDVPGIFSVDESYVDGTPVTVTITVDDVVFSREITLVSAIYDAAEAFYTTNDYSEGKTAAEKYATRSQTPANTNDGSDMWTVGYYEKNDIAGRLYLYPVLQRPKNYRAYEDTLYTGRAAAMTWTISSAYFGSNAAGETASGYTNDADNGWSLLNTNAGQGSLSYNFGSDTYIGNSGAGHTSYAGNTVTPTIIFTAPLDGVINPVLKAAATNANTVMYRMYKVDGAGNYTQIYPLATESANWVQPTCDWDGDYAISDVANNNWAYLPASSNNSWMIQNKGVVRVNKGDKIYLRFAGVAGSEAFALSQLTMNYLGRFGENDELLLDAPFANYEEEYNVLYPANQILDLSREILNSEAKGTMEYKVSGNTDVLRETSIGGVYELTGKINFGGEAAVVTAEYYSKGMSSANGDAPLYTSSTKVYTNAASMQIEPFTAETVKTTQLGYDVDGFVLPYYSDATERAMYGVIDLGIADEWKGAAVTFSIPGKFEYLGNGKIRAIAKHDYTDAGGAWLNTSSTAAPLPAAPAYNGHPAVRGPETMGDNPVVMRITASDGGVKEFNLWAMDEKVHSTTATDYNSYSFDYGKYTTGNAVLKLESIVDIKTNGGTFLPTFVDSARKSQITPVLDDPYIHAQATSYWFPRVPTFTNEGGVDFWKYHKSVWTQWTPNEFKDFYGVAWTFVAPKDGAVKIDKYTVDSLYSNNAGRWMDYNMNIATRKYSIDDSTYETLHERVYKGRSGYYGNQYVSESGTMVNKVESDGSLIVEMKKGEKIRICFSSLEYDIGISSFRRSDGSDKEYLPNPVFTYVADLVDEFDAGVLYVTPSSFEGVSAENVFTLFFDQNGQLIGKSTVADEGDASEGYFGIYLPDAGDVAFAKVFFWDSLTNIQPLAGDIMVRK